MKKIWNSLYGGKPFADETEMTDTTNPTTDKAEEEWIWIEGYKGTDKDMKCRDYQYELGKVHTMSDDEKIKTCYSGFHLCTRLSDVYSYYSIGDGNRFFKVRALVRKEDYETMKRNSSMWAFRLYDRNDTKLAAKSIEFISELTPDEILKSYITDEWTEEDKQEALQFGVSHVRDKHKALETKEKVQTLVSFGYSEPFANWLMSEGKYDIAYAVGSQSDLSMDMKVFVIMREDD